MHSYSGGAIGAGLFVGSGSAFQTGGPGSVLLGFMIVGTLYAISICDVVANMTLGGMMYASLMLKGFVLI